MTLSTKAVAALAAAGCLICSVSANAAKPHMLTAKPLSGRLAHTHQLAHSSQVVIDQDGGDDDDDTAVSLDPNISGLCQSFIGKVNTYAPTRQNVDQIKDDGLFLSGSLAGCGAAQNETTIAVNPSNPFNLVAGTNDYRVFNTREARNDGSGWAYTTFDGGRTWRNVQLPHLTFQTGATGALSDMDSAGDAAVAFGPHNTVYYANLVFSRLNGGSGVVVSTSHDGGRTWGEPSIVHTDGVDANGNPLATPIFNDKEWIAVDPRTGTVYVTWTQFLPRGQGSPILVSSSKDQGRTWSAPVAVNPASGFTPGGVTPFGSGSNPVVNRRGELFIAHEAAVCQTLKCDQPTDHDAIVISTSRDGGQTFTSKEVATNFGFPDNDDVGRATLTGENFRINSFPQLTIDPVTQLLFVTWADNRNGTTDPATGNSVKTNGDVFLVASPDGVHWSPTIGLGTSADEVFPAVAAFGGRVAISFYTRSFDPNGIGLDFAYVSVREDRLDELSHARIHRVTTQTANPQIQFPGLGAVTGQVLQGVFIGDYTAVAMGADGVLHPCWTDFRGAPGLTAPNQDAYTQRIRLDHEDEDDDDQD